MTEIKSIIDQGFLNWQQEGKISSQVKEAVLETIAQLDSGTLRAAEKISGSWCTHVWIKKAILLFFSISENTVLSDGVSRYFDKLPLKFSGYTQADFEQSRARVVPDAIVRKGSYVGPSCVLMPSYINIGAYIGKGTLVDTWATVGSCAQIGERVHISGGVGIGGVLEPLQAHPTIIEDAVFIGARSEIVEGVRVEAGAVIAMGVYIGQSTPIYNRITGKVTYGVVPTGSVVVPGTLPGSDGKYSRYAAIIMKQVDAKTREKVAINDLLREE